MSTVLSTTTVGNVKVTKSLPNFATKKTRKSFWVYNTRMATDTNDPEVATYRRAAQPLRKRSPMLDNIELMDKGLGVGDNKIFVEEDFKKFIDDITYEAVKRLINVSHVTRISKSPEGLEVWAAYDSRYIKRVVSKHGETLEIGASPVTCYRFTGKALANAKKLLKRVRKGNKRA